MIPLPLFLCVCLFMTLSVVQGKFTAPSGQYSNICQETKEGRISNNNNINVFKPNEMGNSNLRLPYLHREIMVSSLDKNTAFWAVNMLESLNKLAHPLEKTGLALVIAHLEVLFIVFDEDSLGLCDSLNLPCWFPQELFSTHPVHVTKRRKSDSSSSITSGGGITMKSGTAFSAGANTNPFRLQAAQRLQAVSQLLGGGANVLLTEADVYWLRSPYTALASNTALLQLPSREQKNGAGILYTRGTPATADLLVQTFELCAEDGGGRKSHRSHRFNCVRQSIEQQQTGTRTRSRPGNITVSHSHLDSTAFPSDGCSWKDLSVSDQHSAYLFFGRCKTKTAQKKKKKGGVWGGRGSDGTGLLATLQYYDQQGMLNIKFLHDWLTTRPSHPLRIHTPKRLYVGGAKPSPSMPKYVDLSLFHNPGEIFKRINQELVTFANRSKNLPDFLERISLHRNDLLG